jgi:hypothetical protein
MPKIQTSCPTCNNPIVAEIQQVIDMGKTPQLKDLLLSGGINLAHCQVCGFQGQLPIPIVYHDPKKELLLTFSPPDLGKTMVEKEAALAPLLKNITDNLEPKDRKGYLFQPKAMMSLNSLVKNVLLEDGITEEMIQKQQGKMQLLDLLFSQEGETLKATVKENNQKIDREFFALFAEIAQRIITSQDEKSIKKVQEIQEILLEESDAGKEIFSETKEIQAATESLEALGKNLTRASLLELIVNAPSLKRIKAITSLVRPAMDYEFFQMVTERIENSEEDIRKSLVEKRNLMLKLTQEIDKQVQERISNAKMDIEEIITSDSIEEKLLMNLNKVDQFFVEAISAELEIAQRDKNVDRIGKLEELIEMIQEITTPVELKILDQLLSVVNEKDKLNENIEKLDDENRAKIGEYLVSVINNYEEQIMNANEEDSKDLLETLSNLKTIYNIVLKTSMKMKFSGE